MSEYKLQQNEALIMKNERIAQGKSSTLNDELLLTNLNLIWISKGLFGKVKTIQRYPINQIKVFEDQPQIFF
ncbi:hypothetical protein M2139_002169 [Enterococcus sp. PF1-24]|uniref:hypothetical protein n=1 Tax=unclassified Enterococcus TaxID=2608891 RepID=UPI00247554D7|nr:MULTISPECIES: hypothetical protein [unclassified Enterococcus]MDH6365147.1 hypothetical protein [Enterococcus sp. PFB1-1]MDH6402269.1 hypothetical protein [Enterococcus sp. PF1-24]